MSDFWQKISNHIGRIKVRSIIDAPAKYLLCILLMAIGAAMAKVASWIVIVFFCFAGAFLILVIVGYIYFAITRPDYLRSEEYNLKKQSLEYLGNKDNYLPVDTHSFVDVVSTTAFLDNKTEEEENE
mgnify:CR=1 FL=1